MSNPRGRQPGPSDVRTLGLHYGDWSMVSAATAVVLKSCMSKGPYLVAVDDCNTDNPSALVQTAKTPRSYRVNLSAILRLNGCWTLDLRVAWAGKGENAKDLFNIWQKCDCGPESTAMGEKNKFHKNPYPRMTAKKKMESACWRTDVCREL
jgi:hypothetical protein